MRIITVLLVFLGTCNLIAQISSTAPGAWGNNGVTTGWTASPAPTSTVRVIHPKILENRDIAFLDGKAQDDYAKVLNNASATPTNKGIAILAGANYTFGGGPEREVTISGISTGFTTSTGLSLEGLTDGITNTSAGVFSAQANAVNKILLNIILASPSKLTKVVITLNGGLGSQPAFKLQATTDSSPTAGSAWIDLSVGSASTFTLNAGTNTLSINTPRGIYKGFRIVGVNTNSISSQQIREVDVFTQDMEFLTNATSSTSTNTISFQTPVNSDLTQQGITSGSFIQISDYDNFSDRDVSPALYFGSGPKLNNQSYFNPILGRVASVSGSSVTVDRAALNYPAATTVTNQRFTASVLLDPINAVGEDIDHDLFVSGTTNSIPVVRFLTGVSNFEGTLGINQGKIYVEAGATLVIGPTECRACDPNDPFYNANNCQSTLAATCSKNRIIVEEKGEIYVEPGGRLIVYGNIYNNAQTGFISVEGGLYVVGSFLIGAASETIGSNAFNQNDIYATQTIQPISGGSLGSVDWFGVKGSFDACLVGPCVASTVACGWSLRTDPAGVIAYCGGKQIKGTYIPPALGNVGTLTYSWERFNGTAWVAAPNTTNALSYTLNASDEPALGSFFYYRLKGSESNGCVAYSPIFQVFNGATVKSWSGYSSTDWGASGNWCQGSVPTLNDDVIIEYEINPAVAGGTTPYNRPVITTTAVAKSLVVKGGSATNDNLITNNGTLTLYGDLQMDLTSRFNSGSSSSVVFAGSSAEQKITHLAAANVDQKLNFNNITVNAAAKLLLPSALVTPLRIDGNLTVNGQLYYGSSSLIKFTGAKNTEVTVGSGAVCEFDEVQVVKSSVVSPTPQWQLQIKSGVAGLNGQLSFPDGTGLLNVLAAGDFILRSSSSFSESNGSIGDTKSTFGAESSFARVQGKITVERFMPQVDLTGRGKSAFRYLGSPVVSPDVYPGALARKWRFDVNVLVTGGGTYVRDYSNLTPGKGYAVFYNDANVKWSIKGLANQGNIRLICPEGLNAADADGCVTIGTRGWHLISNPYPHPIYWGSAPTRNFPNATSSGAVSTNLGKAGNGWGDDWCALQGLTADCLPNSSDTDGNLTGGFLIGSGISHVISIMDVANLPAGQTVRLRLAGLDGFGSISTKEPNLTWFGAGGRGDISQSTYGDRRINDGMIAPGQSFWVYSYGKGIGAAAEASVHPGVVLGGTTYLNQTSYLILTEDAKSSRGSIGQFYRSEENTAENSGQAATSNERAENLLKIYAGQAGAEDFTFVSILEDRKKLKNIQAGVMPKFFTMDLGVYTLHESSSTRALHQETVFESPDQRLYLYFNNMQNDKFYLNFDWSDEFLYSNNLYLNDLLTGQAYPLTKGLKLEFDAAGSVDPEQKRFFLSMQPDIGGPSEKISMNIYPNPATEKIFVNLSDGSVAGSLIKVLNTAGHEVHRAIAGEEFSIDIQSWPVGIYLLSVENRDKIYSGKFIKVK